MTLALEMNDVSSQPRIVQALYNFQPANTDEVNNRKYSVEIAQFAVTINSNVCPHIRVLNTLMRESYA